MKDETVRIAGGSSVTFSMFALGSSLVAFGVLVNGQDLNPARPGPVKPGRHSLITGPARPGCDRQQRPRSLKSGPARPGPTESPPSERRLWSDDSRRRYVTDLSHISLPVTLPNNYEMHCVSVNMYPNEFNYANVVNYMFFLYTHIRHIRISDDLQTTFGFHLPWWA